MKNEKSNDFLGDRMKTYEEITEKILLPRVPICARMDGRAFHSFTKKMTRPYSESFFIAMDETVKALIGEFHSDIGYTQSDEITLIWIPKDINWDPIFGGRIQKMVSNLASFTSVVFNKYIKSLFGSDYAEKNPTFDARVWVVPNIEEAANVLLWRELDATRNSISMAARSIFSHKECLNKNSDELKEMLKSKGIIWDDYPSRFRKGIYFRRTLIKRFLTDSEIEKIPEKYRPHWPIFRHDILPLELSPLIKIEDKVKALFSYDI